MSTTLKINATSKERETFKNNAMATRENDDLEKSVDMFEQILKWDKQNNNVTGLVDVIGHLAIVYRKMSALLKAADKEKSLELSKKALDYAYESIKISEEK